MRIGLFVTHAAMPVARAQEMTIPFFTISDGSYGITIAIVTLSTVQVPVKVGDFCSAIKVASLLSMAEHCDIMSHIC